MHTRCDILCIFHTGVVYVSVGVSVILGLGLFFYIMESSHSRRRYVIYCGVCMWQDNGEFVELKNQTKIYLELYLTTRFRALTLTRDI